MLSAAKFALFAVCAWIAMVVIMTAAVLVVMAIPGVVPLLALLAQLWHWIWSAVGVVLLVILIGGYMAVAITPLIGVARLVHQGEWMRALRIGGFGAVMWTPIIFIAIAAVWGHRS